MEIHLIWAQDRNGGIGQNGKLPWHISEDLKNFKSLTINSTIIMGRKTWDSLPIKPLPNRKNIILSRKKQLGDFTYSSFEECIEKIKKQNLTKVFIIGGRSIYKLFFKYADYLHISLVNLKNEQINEFFPISMNKIQLKFKKINERQLSDEVLYTYWRNLNNYEY